MIYIYADNFRGFQSTYIPIEDVTFFVGENSTGKTSILGLIKLITTPQFWFDQSFNSPEINYGNFEDIASAHSKDRTYFRIGLIQSWTGKGKDIEVGGFLMTFNKRRGLPILTKYSFNHKGKSMTLKITGKTVNYKMEDTKEYEDIPDFIKNVFNQWIDYHKNDKKGYKRLLEYRDTLSIYIAQKFAENLLTKSKEKEHSFDGFAKLLPFVTQNLALFGPIRTKPSRTYDEYRIDFSPEGDHTPYLIKRYFDRKSDRIRFKRFLEKFGQRSGLFDSLDIKAYGKKVASPFELEVIIKGKHLNISNVGYGVSQALPLIVEIFSRPKNSFLAIQQPEVHLHPKAQAALGDVLFDLAASEQKKFIIETHNDYAIDGFRLNYGSQQKKKPRSQILFFERTKEGNRVYQLPISENGKLPEDQPKAYREFFIRENLRLLGL